MFRKFALVLALVSLTAMVLGGCYGSEEAEKSETQVSTEMQAKLMLADKVDGTSDKVIGKCPGCKLAMAGSAEHPLKVGEYEMHFCSNDCKANFAGDLEKSVLALKAPEDTGHGEHDGHNH